MNNLLNQDKHFSYILVINKERDERIQSNLRECSRICGIQSSPLLRT